MVKTFAKVRLCHTNDFQPTQNEGIKRWVENNGGTFHQEIKSDTTHLVCSKKAWKRRVHHRLVQEATRRNRDVRKRKLPQSKMIKIVKYDWLEDSLQSKSRKPKDTAAYDWEQKLLGPDPTLLSPPPCPLVKGDKPSAETKVEKIDRKMIEFNKEIAEFESTMQTRGYHPYKDSTGFLYLIVLVRRDIEKTLIERHKIKVRYSSSPPSIHSTCPIRHLRFPIPCPFAAYPVVSAHRPNHFKFKPSCPKRKLRVPIPNPWAHCLQLFESYTTPRKYACYLAYSSGRNGLKMETHVLAPAGSDWEFAWGMFTKIFKLKTGVEWNARPASEMGDTSRLQIDGPTAGVLRRYFEYVTPKMGEPQGLRDSGGCTDGASTETHSLDEADRDISMDDVLQSIDGMERRPSVILMMPSGANPEWNDIEASARTPEGGW